MSTTFFILPFDPKAWEDPNDTSPKPTSDLRISREDYRQALINRWEGITLPSYSDLSWELPPESREYGGLHGYLQENQQIVSFGTGPKQSFIDFILFHRSFVPEDYELFLCNSSSWDRLLLTKATTVQDIIDFTGIVD